MYLRKCYREKEGKRYAYWQLVESYRTARGPRQRVVAYLGDLEESVREGLRQAAGERGSDGQGLLFEEERVVPEWVESNSASSRRPFPSAGGTKPGFWRSVVGSATGRKAGAEGFL